MTTLKRKWLFSATAITQRGYQTNNKDVYWTGLSIERRKGWKTRGHPWLFLCLLAVHIHTPNTSRSFGSFFVPLEWDYVSRVVIPALALTLYLFGDAAKPTGLSRFVFSPGSPDRTTLLAGYMLIVTQCFHSRFRKLVVIRIRISKYSLFYFRFLGAQASQPIATRRNSDNASTLCVLGAAWKLLIC